MAQDLTIGDLLYKLGFSNETEFLAVAEKLFDQTERKASESGEKAGAGLGGGLTTGLGGFKDEFSKIFSAGAIGGLVAGVVLGAFTQASQAASQFVSELKDRSREIEAENIKISTVFGTTENAIRQWSEGAAKNLGISSQATATLAANVQDLLVPMGFQRQEATELTKKTLDLAAALSQWTNGQMSSEEVTDILTKAYTGERESLKSLGISINEADIKQRLLANGQANLTGLALEQAKATATLELITEKSSDAQKAFAENVDSVGRSLAEANSRAAEAKDTLAVTLKPALDDLALRAANLGAGLLELVNNGVILFDNALGDGAEVRRVTGEGIEMLIGKLEGYRDNLVITSEAERTAAVEGLNRQKQVLVKSLEIQAAYLKSLEQQAQAYAEMPWWKYIFNIGAANVTTNAIDQAVDDTDALIAQLNTVSTQLDDITTSSLSELGTRYGNKGNTQEDNQGSGTSTSGSSSPRVQAAKEEAKTLEEIQKEQTEAQERAAKEEVQRLEQLKQDRAKARADELAVTQAWIKNWEDRVSFGTKNVVEALGVLAPRLAELREEVRTALNNGDLEGASLLIEKFDMLKSVVDDFQNQLRESTQIEYDPLSSISIGTPGKTPQEIAKQQLDAQLELQESRVKGEERASRREEQIRQANLDAQLEYQETRIKGAERVARREAEILEKQQQAYLQYINSRIDGEERLARRNAQILQAQIDAQLEYQNSRIDGEKRASRQEQKQLELEQANRDIQDFSSFLQQMNETADILSDNEERAAQKILELAIAAEKAANAITHRNFLAGTRFGSESNQNEFTRQSILQGLPNFGQGLSNEDLLGSLRGIGLDDDTINDVFDGLAEKLAEAGEEAQSALEDLQSEIADIALSFPKAILEGIRDGDIGGALQEALGSASDFFIDKMIEGILGPIAQQLAASVASSTAATGANAVGGLAGFNPLGLLAGGLLFGASLLFGNKDKKELDKDKDKASVSGAASINYNLEANVSVNSGASFKDPEFYATWRAETENLVISLLRKVKRE